MHRCIEASTIGKLHFLFYQVKDLKMAIKSHVIIFIFDLLSLQLSRTKVRMAGKYCRVSLSIRANPLNKKDFTDVVIIVAVPPDVDGNSIRMSRKGAWDSMKRLVTWHEPVLERSKKLDISLQFGLHSSLNPQISYSKQPAISKFPVLIRCDAHNDHISDITFDILPIEENQTKKILQPNIHHSYRLLHRNI